MKICHITTFFGRQSFGGDATYVDHLSRAQLRLGHEVHVIHCIDAYQAVRGKTPLRSYEKPRGLRVHELSSPVRALSPIWTHQFGGPGPKWASIRKILITASFDVVHLHNLSLVGGPRLVQLIRGQSPQSIVLMTSHEHWLVCPLSLRFRRDHTICHGGRCFLCSITSGKPPQLWRFSPMMRKNLQLLNGLIFPSKSAMQANSDCGADPDIMVTIPYFLPGGWADQRIPSFENPATGARRRPYFAAVGRLVKEKGFDSLIPMFRRMPGIDLRIAGSGPESESLKKAAADLSNVVFEGPLDFSHLEKLYRGARAVVVPSKFLETFGYILLEAFSAGTPAIVRNIGALPEVVASAGGGIICNDDHEILKAIQKLANDEETARELGQNGAESVRTLWSEMTHMDLYFKFVNSVSNVNQDRCVAERSR